MSPEPKHNASTDTLQLALPEHDSWGLSSHNMPTPSHKSEITSRYVIISTPHNTVIHPTLFSKTTPKLACSMLGEKVQIFPFCLSAWRANRMANQGEGTSRNTLYKVIAIAVNTWAIPLLPGRTKQSQGRPNLSQIPFSFSPKPREQTSRHSIVTRLSNL